MTSATFEPLLVSELPPVPPVPTLRQRITRLVRERMWERRFERALRHAGHAEALDLLALSRRG
jgi:hypothetical protein